MQKTIFYCLFYLFFYVGVYHTQVIPLQNNGHTKMISSLEFWEDEKWFATGGTDNLIKIWDFRTLKEINTFEGHKYSINALAVFESEGKKYIISGGISELKVWDVATGKLYKNIYNNDQVVSIVYNKAQNKIFYATKQNVYELGLKYFQPKYLFNIKNDIVDFKVSNNGKLLFASTKKSVFVYDDQKQLKQVYNLEKMDNIYELSINADGDKILASGLNYVHYWSVKDTYKFDYWTFGKANASAFFSNNDSKIYARKYQESLIYVFDSENKILLDSLEVPKDMISLFKIRLSPSEKYLGGFGFNQIMFWDIESGKKINKFNKVPNSINTIVHRDNLLGISIAGKGKIALFDWEKCILNEIKNSQTDRVNFLHFDPKNHLISHAQDGSVSYQNLSDYKTLRTIRYFEQKKNNEDEKQTNIDAFINAFTKNVMYEVAYSFKNNLFAMTGNNDLYLYSTENNAFIDTLYGHLDLIKSVCFNKNQDKILTSSLDKNARIWDLKNPEQNILISDNKDRIFTAIFSSNEKYIFTGAADGFVKMFDAITGTLIKNIGHYTHPVRDLFFDEESNEILISTEYQTLVQNVDDQMKSLTLYESNIEIEKSILLRKNIYAIQLKNETILMVHREKGVLGTLLFSNDENIGFVFYTPDGYYMGDKETVQNNIHFIAKNKVFLFEQFDLFYNRPDIILERLECSDQLYIEGLKKAFQKRIEKLGFKTDFFNEKPSLNVPEVSLKNVPFYQSTKNNLFLFELLANDPNESLQKLQVIVNGIPLFSEGGKLLNRSRIAEEKVNLILSSGDNIIEVFVVNEKGVSSLKERFLVNYSPENLLKPNLFLVTVGASQYKDQNMNLKYASKDGDDIVSLFKKGNATFQKINSLQIKDKNVTLNALKKIEKFISKAKVDDVVLFFISGHGVFDADYNYYLATYDIDFLNPSLKGIPYQKLELLLGKSKSRNKVLFLDACHSGEIDKDEIESVENISVDEGEITFRNFGNTTIQSKSNVGLNNSFELQKQLFTDLRLNNGTNVVSASGGNEFAMEGNEWKNGVFTYTFLSGIIQKSADLNQDGIVMLSELQEYVEEGVFKLTNGRQKPTSRVKNLVHDFYLWKY